MGKALTTRHSPVAGTVLGTHIRRPFALQFFGNVGRIDGIEFIDVGQFEGSGTVGHEGIGKQHDGRHVLQGDLTSLIGGIETVGRTGGSHHRHGTLTITAEECLQQIGLF